MPEIPQIENLLEFLKLNVNAVGPQLQLILWGMAILCLDFLFDS